MRRLLGRRSAFAGVRHCGDGRLRRGGGRTLAGRGPGACRAGVDRGRVGRGVRRGGLDGRGRAPRRAGAAPDRRGVGSRQGRPAPDGGQGFHRALSMADLLVAATAERHGVVVLHYDGDYEMIAAVTGRPTQWVAPPEQPTDGERPAPSPVTLRSGSTRSSMNVAPGPVVETTVRPSRAIGPAVRHDPTSCRRGPGRPPEPPHRDSPLPGPCRRSGTPSDTTDRPPISSQSAGTRRSVRAGGRS